MQGFQNQPHEVFGSGRGGVGAVPGAERINSDMMVSLNDNEKLDYNIQAEMSK